MLIAINYRAIDQARLLELYKDDPKAAVLGDHSATLKPGQFAYISAETGNAVLPVKSVTYDANYLLEARGFVSRRRWWSSSVPRRSMHRSAR